MSDNKALDIAVVGRIDAVPAILQVISETTGMRFAAVARVTESAWTACAVLDTLGFGLEVGDELDVATTLCHEIRASHHTVVIDKVSDDEQYCDHHTPRLYGFESYISVPVFRVDGTFFGTLCALDPRPANLKASSVQPMMESFARLLAIQIDNQERYQRTEEALLAEREVGDLRDQFIAVLGHDLRNPLFAIGAGAELLQRRTQDDKSLNIIQHILTSARRASQLVEDVLDFARGRLGAGIVVNLKPCNDLAQSLEHVVAEVQRAHPLRTLHLTLGDLQGIVCDRERVGQLLSNLVSNAVMHGVQDGAVRIEAARVDGAYQLSVHNHGAAIPPDVRAQLFKPFARPSVLSPRSGLGLGLYIAQQIAKAHGGTLTVDSTDEAGTVFTFTLPVSQSLAELSR